MIYSDLVFLSDTAPTDIYPLSLHDALPIWNRPAVVTIQFSSRKCFRMSCRVAPSARRVPICLVRSATDSEVMPMMPRAVTRSEEHTSELQSHSDLVCRLLLEKKKRTRQRQA